MSFWKYAWWKLAKISNTQTPYHSLLASRVYQVVKMSLFVSSLTPIIRICQWSGLCPLDLDRGTAFSTKNIISYKILLAFWLIIDIGHFLHGFTQHNVYIDWETAKLLIFIDIITPVFLRLHVIVLFIESYSNRSQQVEMLDKFAEIEAFFASKFDVKIDARYLQRRFRFFLVLWLLRVAGTLSCLLLVRSWGRVYYQFLYIVPFYTSSLMYAQFSAYVDTIRYCIEMLNKEVGRFSMSHLSRSSASEKENREEHTFIFVFDKISRIRDLQHGYQLIWQATRLVNSYSHWSLPVGLNNEFITLINDFYWICLVLLDPKKPFSYQILIVVIYGFINSSHIYQTSTLCGQTVAAVSLCLFVSYLLLQLLFTWIFRWTEWCFFCIIYHSPNQTKISIYWSVIVSWLCDGDAIPIHSFNFQIHNFSLQISHQDISFSVLGFWCLDNTFIFSVRTFCGFCRPMHCLEYRIKLWFICSQIIAAVTTYLIILLQLSSNK